MFHLCPKGIIHCAEIRVVHVPVFRYSEARVVGTGQSASVVGLGSHEFMGACAICNFGPTQLFFSNSLLKYA